MYKKTIIILLIILFASMFYVNCGEETKEKIVLKVTFWEIGPGRKAFDSIFRKFEADHPGVKIKGIHVLSSAYGKKVLTMIASGTAPDIIRVGSNNLGTFILKKVLLPLDNYIKNDKFIHLNEYFEVPMKQYKYNGEVFGKGEIYGMCTDWSPDACIFYNKEIFNRANIPYPKKSLSWEELLTIAKKLTIRDSEGRAKQFGIYIPYKIFSLIFVLQNKGRIFSEDGKRCLLDSPEAIEGIKFAIELSTKYKVAPSYSEAMEQSQDSADILFRTGRVGMFLSGRYRVPILKEFAPQIKFGVAPITHKKIRANIIGGACGWAICAATKYKKLSWELFEYLLSPEIGQKEMAKTGYNIPSHKETAYSDVFPNPQNVNKVFFEELKYSFPPTVLMSPYIAKDEWQEIFVEEYDEMLLQKKTVEEGCKDIAKRINAIIKQNIQEGGFNE